MLSLVVKPAYWGWLGLWRALKGESLMLAGVLASHFGAVATFLMFQWSLSAPTHALSDVEAWVLLGVYALALLAALVRGRVLLLTIGLAGGHVLLASQFNWPEESFFRAHELEFVAWSGRLSLLYFVLRGRVRSPEYFGAMVAIFFVAPVPYATVYLALTLGLRFVFLVVWQNFTILLDIGIPRALLLSVKTLVCWAPILLFMVPSIMLTNYIQDATKKSIYENGILVDSSAPTADSEFIQGVTLGVGADTSPVAPENPNVEADIKARIEREFDIARSRVDAKLEQIRAQVRGNVGAIPAEVLRIYGEVVPPANQIPGLAPSESNCSWYDVPCHILHEIIESIKGGIRKSYDETRAREGLKLYYETMRKCQEAGANSDRVIDDTKVTLRNHLDSTESACIASVEKVFRAIDAFNLLSNILISIVMIKSYLYVFARIAFTKQSRASISLRRKGGNPRHGSVKKWGRQFGIDASCPVDYFVSRRFEPNGRAPHFTLPQPFTGILKRLRFGAYTMNRIRFGGGRGAVYFTGVRGAEFVSWHLEPGETVVFDYKNFVAMTDGITLSSEVSFRVSSLLFGRVVFPTATGPGTLVLQSQGNPTIGTEQKSSASVPPTRILAFHDHTRFTVESELNMVDLYMSSAYLERVGRAPIVIDADTMNSPMTGLARFIRYFILPA